MAYTSGLVYRVGISEAMACVYIGPSETQMELFLVKPNAGDTPKTLMLKAGFIDALSSALLARRSVTVEHGEGDASITMVAID